MSNSKLLLIVIFCSLLGGVVLVADIFTVTEESDIIYGKGVHAFFDRNYEEAITILSAAEKKESNDPRSYYFLGLAYLRQKKSEQADQYFEKAAQLEYSGRTLRDYEVSESLRRIQGNERMRIEKIRTAERINAQKREQRLMEIRYGKETATDRESLQQLSPQNQREEDLAVLQKMTESFGENTFGVQPIDPTNTLEKNLVKRKSESNPFGEVVVNVPEIIEPKPTTDRIDRTDSNRDTTVNINIPAKNRENVGKQAALSVSPIRSAQATAVKELGRGLGVLFSKKPSTDEEE